MPCSGRDGGNSPFTETEIPQPAGMKQRACVRPSAAVASERGRAQSCPGEPGSRRVHAYTLWRINESYTLKRIRLIVSKARHGADRPYPESRSAPPFAGSATGWATTSPTWERRRSFGRRRSRLWSPASPAQSFARSTMSWPLSAWSSPSAPERHRPLTRSRTSSDAASPDARSRNVFLNGRLVGRLNRHSSGAIDFRYDPAWLDREHALPVSLSLPLRED
ncbi:HipA N-terminal domain-containing protein [Mycobacterium sp. KBS0706]|uniref:HipA N-terminal domain-containing protein n=1 Tax=Mycobacterium sp. KBS0706 TaxID=2578109 RepID=UPI00359F6AD9